MAREYRTFVNILKKQPGYRMGRIDLSNEMARRRTLGFGVEIDDFIFALTEEGLASYDKETDTVTYIPPVDVAKSEKNKG